MLVMERVTVLHSLFRVPEYFPKVRSFDTFCVNHDVPAKLNFYGFSNASYILPNTEGTDRNELAYQGVADNFPSARRTSRVSLNSLAQATTLD
jgi:hypothetical protein